MYEEVCTSGQHPFLEAGWSYCSGPVTQNSDILPDNCFDVLLDLSSGTSHISGIMSQVAARKTPENRHVLGLRIKAEYLSRFTKTPAHELRDIVVDANDVIPQLAIAPLIDRLATLGPLAKQTVVFCEVLNKCRLPQHLKHERFVRSLTNQYRSNPTNHVEGNKCETQCTIGPRQRQRAFKRIVGLSEQEFAGIARLQFATRRLQQIPSKSLLHIAFESGYYDHAHMTKDFKKTTGRAPSSFR